jgi:glycosyltransferase involved in cell wall biosynthesis
MIEDAISVVMPTYNRGHLIKRATESCLGQLDEKDELIIIDDGSTDDTERVVARYGDKVRYIRTPNYGAGAARNRGIQEARKPLLAFIDSDDEWLLGKIRIQRDFMNAMPDVLFSFTNFSFKAADGKKSRFALVNWSKDHRSWDEILGEGRPASTIMTLHRGDDDFYFHTGSMYLLELFENYINVKTLMIRREQAGEALHFAEGTPTYEDWEFFSRISREGKAAYLDIETTCQHGHCGPRLTNSHITECAMARVGILERVYGNDAVFLHRYSASYRKVLDEQRIIWVKGLIVRGEIGKAREQLKKVTALPVMLDFITILPEAVIRCALTIYRFLKKAGHYFVDSEKR